MAEVKSLYELAILALKEMGIEKDEKDLVDSEEGIVKDSEEGVVEDSAEGSKYKLTGDSGKEVRLLFSRIFAVNSPVIVGVSYFIIVT
jgi:hypothetical protein